MQKTCRQCAQQFEVMDEDLKFYDKVSPVFSGEKYDVPAPTLCPDCRQQRRLSWHNMIHLYHRKCDRTGKEMISNISVDKPYKVYINTFWWSDKYDPLAYGKEFDYSKPFFDQFNELLIATPFPNLISHPPSDINCDFTNYALYDKNCYMIFHANDNEDCYYSFGIKFCRDCVDNYSIFNSELLYECLDCEKSYHLKYCSDCENCSESYFLNACIGCKNCIGCHNLRNAEYCIFNKKVDRGEYKAAENELKKGSHLVIKKWQQKFEKFLLTQPRVEVIQHQNENCTGDRIFRCKNVQESFDVKETESGKFVYRVFNGPNRDLYDVYQYGMNTELAYECSIIGTNAYNLLFCALCRTNVSNLIYCYNCHHSKNCFGCANLHHKEYCLFNKQYSKTEYEKEVAKIIEHMQKTGEWGEFFPSSLSPFGYNETLAMDHYPMDETDAYKINAKWKKGDLEQSYKGQKIGLPDEIKDLDETASKQIFQCEACGKNYKLIAQELEFYKKQSLPAPRNCFFCRQKGRIASRNPNKLWTRKCSTCDASIRTSFAPDRPERVCCEDCYLKESYGSLTIKNA